MQIRKVYNPVSGSEENRAVKPSADGLDKIILQTKPVFSNVAPLIPIVAQEVMERNEIDLVDMQSLEHRRPGTEFKYVLSVEDVFSHYIFLGPLRTKTSDEVAQELEEIYQDFQTPSHIAVGPWTWIQGAGRNLKQFDPQQISAAEGPIYDCDGLLTGGHVSDGTIDAWSFFRHVYHQHRLHGSYCQAH